MHIATLFRVLLSLFCFYFPLLWALLCGRMFVLKSMATAVCNALSTYSRMANDSVLEGIRYSGDKLC